MGYYVNPTNKSKEEFLREKGVAVPRTFKWTDLHEGSLPVVLLDNGAFTAAGIAYSTEEFAAFTRVDDRRPKQIYTVPISELVAHANDPGFNEIVKSGKIAT